MKLLKFIISVVVVYVLLKAPGLLFSKPIPASLIAMYLFFSVVVILLVMTSTDEGTSGLAAPLSAFLKEPRMKIARNAVFAALPVLAGYMTYVQMGTDSEPVELRYAHPAPPSVFKAYGKTFNLTVLENPFRHLEKDDPAGFKELVSEGGATYFKNCFFCHGAKLDGHGHFAHGLNPLPPSFQGSDTIAQLKESYVFWRVVKGGAGLPKEASPATSSMPSWENSLSEEDVWKVIAFLYDYTGNRPR